MKLLSTFIISTIFIHTTVALVDNSDVLKLTNFTVFYVNKNYLGSGEFSLKLVEVNKTYSRLDLSFRALEDLPDNTVFKTKVYRSKTPDGPEEKLAVYKSHICDLHDKYRKYLPTIFITITEAGNCVKKGTHSSHDAGIFEFYDLQPREMLERYYFRSDNFLKISNTILIHSQAITVPLKKLRNE